MGKVFFLMYMVALPPGTSVCMQVFHAWCLSRPEEVIRSPEAGLTESCERCVCWELNTGPLE